MTEKLIVTTTNKVIDQFLEADGWYEVAACNYIIRDKGFNYLARAIRKAASNGTLLWSKHTLHTSEFHLTK